MTTDTRIVVTSTDGATQAVKKALVTWRDTVVDNGHGGYDLRCRFADRFARLSVEVRVYPVDANGHNLTRYPITVRMRASLGTPLPQTLGRDGDICLIPGTDWQPKEAPRTVSIQGALATALPQEDVR